MLMQCNANYLELKGKYRKQNGIYFSGQCYSEE